MRRNIPLLYLSTLSNMGSIDELTIDRIYSSYKKGLYTYHNVVQRYINRIKSLN